MHSSEASRSNVYQLSEHAFVKTPVGPFLVAAAGANNNQKHCAPDKINGKAVFFRMHWCQRYL